jgi:hypothetical protein
MALMESCVSRLVKDRNLLLLSAGTDSTCLAGILRKLGREKSFTFVHAYSANQSFTEAPLVDQFTSDMGLAVKKVNIPLTGDVLSEQSGRQYSFWRENPFSGKRIAVESAGAEDARIFTGEVGDQLFGGPKNSTLLCYALQSPRISAAEIAQLWIHLSATYGQCSSLVVPPRVADIFADYSEAKDVYDEVVQYIADLFRSMSSKDFLNRILLLNYVIKGPYRTWAYSQDTLDWVHPFAAWELFEYSYRLRSDQKIFAGGRQKAILFEAWRPYLSEIPWSVPKHGFGIPSIEKIRSQSLHLDHRSNHSCLR